MYDLLDTRYVILVDRHLGWDESERAERLEALELVAQAEDLVEVAEAADELDRALTPLRQALELLGPLGDVPAESRALLLVARIESLDAAGGIDVQTLDEVLRLARPMRDLDTVWTTLGLQYEAAILDQDYDQAEEILLDQYQIAHETDDQDTVRQLTDRMLALEWHREQTGL